MVGFAAMMQAGCSSDPTEAGGTYAPELSTQPKAAAATPAVGGPDSIYVSGIYTYGATYLAPYASTQWATRNCPSLTVASCTTPWATVIAQTIDAYHWRYNASVAFDCSNNKKNSFQVRVIFHAFGQAPPPVYKVTRKCGSDPIR